MNARKKVIILGGGVAGMSAAHELIERGFDVEVYERKRIAGGKARSMSVPDSATEGRKPLPGEHVSREKGLVVSGSHIGRWSMSFDLCGKRLVRPTSLEDFFLP